jgi:hypothetical protein
MKNILQQAILFSTNGIITPDLIHLDNLQPDDIKNGGRQCKPD